MYRGDMHICLRHSLSNQVIALTHIAQRSGCRAEQGASVAITGQDGMLDYGLDKYLGALFCSNLAHQSEVTRLVGSDFIV